MFLCTYINMYLHHCVPFFSHSHSHSYPPPSPTPHRLTPIPSPQAIAVFATSSAEVVAAYDGEDGTIGVMDIGKLIGVQYGRAYEYIWYVGLLTSAQASTMTTTYAGMLVVVVVMRSNTW